MPRTKNQPNSWNIPYAGDLLAKDSETRRMVDGYKGLAGINQDEAVARLIKAGYAHLVGTTLPDKISLDRPPTQRRVGRRSPIEERTRTQESGDTPPARRKSRKNQASTESDMG